MRTRVKICGVTTPAHAGAAAEAGADAIGLVFAPGSPRRLEPGAAAEILFGLPPMVTAVGLMVDPTIDEFLATERACPTHLTQLHGSEPVRLVQQCGPGVIKSVRFDAETIDEQLARWDEVEEVDAILVDGSPGGRGTPFDWVSLRGALDRVGVTTPIIVAGGLTPENVGEVIRAVRPFGVDVSSGVEVERGVKDPDLIHAFCQAVREADRSL